MVSVLCLLPWFQWRGWRRVLVLRWFQSIHRRLTVLKYLSYGEDPCNPKITQLFLFKTTAVTEPGVVKHVHCLPCCLIILLRVFVVIVFLSSNRLHSNCNKIRFHQLGKINECNHNEIIPPKTVYSSPASIFFFHVCNRSKKVIYTSLIVFVFTSKFIALVGGQL